MSKTAVCVIKGEKVNGVVKFTQENKDSQVNVEYDITGLEKGEHGFHVHAFGDTTNGCISAGPHYNPFGKNHGGPQAEDRHVGDLGNILSSGDAPTKGTITDKLISLFGEHTIVGRTMVVHEGQDDFGLGGKSDSLTTGAAGARLGCGVIGVSQ